MTLECIEHQTTDTPGAILIVLHGLGADGNDFVPIAQELDLAAVGGARFIFPHAPTRPVTMNGGFVMRAWYDIAGTPQARREDEAGLRESRSQVEALIARGDRRGGDAIEIAFQKGARFDAWSEGFNFDRWIQSFQVAGLSTEEFLGARTLDQPLPWEGVDLGVTRQALLRERERSLQNQTSPACNPEQNQCLACGIGCLSKKGE